MRRFTLPLIIAAAVAIVPAAAAAQAPVPAPVTAVPPPQPIVIKLGDTPTVQLSDGGGGLPFLGSTVPYNAGALVPALTNFHDSGLYDQELAQIGTLADAWVRHRAGGGDGGRSARASKAAKASAKRAKPG